MFVNVWYRETEREKGSHNGGECKFPWVIFVILSWWENNLFWQNEFICLIRKNKQKKKNTIYSKLLKKEM